MKDNHDETVKITEAFKQKHQPSTKATVHALMTEMEMFDKSNFRSEQHAQWQDMFNRVDDSMAICHATVVPPQTVQAFLSSIMAPHECMPATREHIDMECHHPQALKTIHMSIPREYILADQKMLNPRQLVTKNPMDQPAKSKMICTFPDRVAQGDSGANRALTNGHTLLTDFTLINPFPIRTIGPKPIMATQHRGIMRLPTIKGGHEGFTTYNSKDSSRSVISLDRHVSESNERLQQWIQYGDIDSGNGSMIFLDNDLRKVATVKMYRTNGLWYARASNDKARINITDTLSIQTTTSDAHVEDQDYMPGSHTRHMDTDMINMVINDDLPQPDYASPLATT